jgi:hypothetical protein
MSENVDLEWNQGFGRGRVIVPGTFHQLGTFGLFQPPPSQGRVLNVSASGLEVRLADAGLLWLSFGELCSGQVSTADAGALAAQYRTWVIDGVPGQSGTDEALRQRFARLAAILEDRDVTVFVIAARVPAWGPENPLSRLVVLESSEEVPAEELGGC